MDFDLLQSNLSLSKPAFYKGNLTFSAQKIVIRDIGYYQFLFNQIIKLGTVDFQHPVIQIRSGDSSDAGGGSPMKKPVFIGNLKLSNAQVQLFGRDTSKITLLLGLKRLSLKQLEMDSVSLKEKIPFRYKELGFAADSLRINMNPEHIVTAESILYDNGKVQVDTLEIQPLYSRAAFNRRIPYEKDRLSLMVKKLELDQLRFRYVRDTLLLQNSVMNISDANLKIYRNKKLPDDPRPKPLYSELLRKAPIFLDFEKVIIKGSQIVYEELVNEERGPAVLNFKQVEGNIQNIVNYNSKAAKLPETKITAQALFMGSTPVDIDWSFNVDNRNDSFTISGSFGTLSGEALDPLLIPANNLKARGTIKKAFFNFYGNDEFINGDVRMEYENFKIKLLEQEEKGVKKIVSALANLLVDNDGKSGSSSTKEVRLSRDIHKSFWHYAWSALREGIKKILSQV